MPDNDFDPSRFATAFKAFTEAVAAAATPLKSPLIERLKAHLAVELAQIPVITEEYDSFEHPNLQLALDEYMASPARQADLVGVAADNKRFMGLNLSDILSRGEHSGGPPLNEGPVDYINFHLAGDRVLSCIQFGLYLLRDDQKRLVVFVGGSTEHGPQQKLGVAVAAAYPEDGREFLMELTGAMKRLNVYRGHTISLSPGQFGPGPQTLIAFHRLPHITREDVILPEGVLDRIERQTIIFAEYVDRLRAAGRPLKRGLLLYGPPGVGKTLTVQYLVSHMPGRTVFLTAGLGLGFLQPVVQLARSLEPSMVVLEDVDLIAEERGMPFGHAGPLLFELLNEMDGLQEDSDVIFLLTTNRPEVLEPALAARPGRIDLAVALPLPDVDGRRRLLELYAQGLQLESVDLDALAERIAGATPAYIKEVLRKAAVLAAIEGGEVVVTGAQIEAALADLDEGGRLARSLLGFRPTQGPADPTEEPGAIHRVMATGFPPGGVSAMEIETSG